MVTKMSKTTIFKYIVTPLTLLQTLLYDIITKIINHTLLVFTLSNTAKYKLSQGQKFLILKVALAQCMSIFTDFRALFGPKIDASFTPF